MVNKSTVPPGPGITVYGAADCEDTAASRELLDERQVPYKYVDLDLDLDAAAWVRAHNGGPRSTPTITFGDGNRVLVEPTDDELLAALHDTGYLQSPGD